MEFSALRLIADPSSHAESIRTQFFVEYVANDLCRILCACANVHRDTRCPASITSRAALSGLVQNSAASFADVTPVRQPERGSHSSLRNRVACRRTPPTRSDRQIGLRRRIGTPQDRCPSEGFPRRIREPTSQRRATEELAEAKQYSRRKRVCRNFCADTRQQVARVGRALALEALVSGPTVRPEKPAASKYRVLPTIW